MFEDTRTYGLDDPEIRDFGTSFRISIHRKPFETDLFGAVIPSTRAIENHNSVSKHNESQSESLNDTQKTSETEHDTQKTSSASTDDQKKAKDALLAFLPEKNRARADRILECMILNPHSTAVQTGKEIRLSKATVQRAIDGMKAAGIVSRQGSNNGGQ